MKYSNIFYPARVSDPNQIKPQSFVEGKQSNFYLIHRNGENDNDFNTPIKNNTELKGNFYRKNFR